MASWGEYCPTCNRFQHDGGNGKCVVCGKPVKWADEDNPPPTGPIYDDHPDL